MKMRSAVVIAAALLPISERAIAVEPLSTPELAEHCAHYFEDRDGKDAIFCIRYIQGFIDGAVATDKRVINNVAAEYDQDESFSDRAIRTRIVSRTMRVGPTAYADFCLGELDSLVSVVEKIVEDLDNRPVLEEQLLARDAVFVTLQREFPCDPDEKE